MAPVISLSVNSVDMSHKSGQIPFWGMDNNVVMLCVVINYVKLHIKSSYS